MGAGLRRLMWVLKTRTKFIVTAEGFNNQNIPNKENHIKKMMIVGLKISKSQGYLMTLTVMNTHDLGSFLFGKKTLTFTVTKSDQFASIYVDGVLVTLDGSGQFTYNIKQG